MIKVKDLFSVNKSKISVIFLFLLLTLSFGVTFKLKVAINFDSFIGAHSFQSGSTLKFVNNWLVESPQKLHFLNFELPDSIEFNGLSEREPYISYPSGCTFFVYIFAKMFDRQMIDISFLKHFQLVCFWIETLLFAIFVYRFLKNIGIKSEIEKIIAVFLTAIFWVWLPINVWYLANVYFADQCIILFVMAFLYVEYEFYCCKNTRARFILNLIKAFLIFAGVLIDYYFWIFTFVAFVLQVVRSIKNKTTPMMIIKNSLCYVIPFVFAIGVFIYQLSFIPNWQTVLGERFLFRVGAANSEYDTIGYIVKQLYIFFIDGFGLKVNMKLFSLLLLILCLHSGNEKSSKSFYTVIKESVFTNSGFIVLLGILSPIIQIIFLKNHSALHEFSEVKLSWIVAMIPVIVSVIYYKTHEDKGSKLLFGIISVTSFLKFFLISFLCVVFITGVPFSSREYKDYHELVIYNYDYHLAKILRDNTSYEHVCFSSSCFIPTNPPQELAVSRKRVYKINDRTELNTMFPNLNSQAVKIFVIDKDAVSELTDEQIAVQNELRSTNKVFFEDERFCLLELAD